jgi:hypothetical protein
VPTNQQLAQSITHINGLDPLPDAVIATSFLGERTRVV